MHVRSTNTVFSVCGNFRHRRVPRVGMAPACVLRRDEIVCKTGPYKYEVLESGATCA